MKKNRGTIFALKALVLIIINLWLLMIFRKIIILDGKNITNNIIALTKMQTLLNPLLTIRSGLIMGGMWYMNNVGRIINIGSLLSRLGVSIFSSNPARLSQSVAALSVYSRPKPEAVVEPELEARIARLESRGFFRQLGAKVLELLDVMIEKFKDKRQKYN